MPLADIAYYNAVSSCPISWDASIDLFYFWIGIAVLFLLYLILDNASKPRPPKYPPYPPYR